VGLRAGLDDVEERKFLTLPGLDLRPLGHPSRSQSLYRLRYHYPVRGIFCMLISVTCSPQANYTDRANAACRQS
jgi:hypothetical protein